MKLRFEVECGPDEPAEGFFEIVNAQERLVALRAAVREFDEALRAVSKSGGIPPWATLLSSVTACDVRTKLHRLLEEHGAALEGGVL